MVASKNDNIIKIMKTNRLIDDTEDTVPKVKRKKRLKENQGCKGRKKIFLMQLKRENIISYFKPLNHSKQARKKKPK
jgi:hypothetical protein